MGAGCGGGATPEFEPESYVAPEPEPEQKLEPSAGSSRVDVRATRNEVAAAMAGQPAPSTSPGSPSLKNTVWVGGLPDWLISGQGGAAAEAELRRLFSVYGEVRGVSVREKPGMAVGDKSWAFVTFARHEAVDKAAGASISIVSAQGVSKNIVVRRASTTPPPRDDGLPREGGGAMMAMLATQQHAVLGGVLSPMQQVIETLRQLSLAQPSVANALEGVVEVLTTTEDLWAIHGSSSAAQDDDIAADGSLSPRNLRSPSAFWGLNGEVKDFLMNECTNAVLFEAEEYSAKLARSRGSEDGHSGAAAPLAEQQKQKQVKNRALMKAFSVDFPQQLERMLPDIGAGARAELATWEAKLDDWEFDIFRVSELTNGRPLFFIFSVVMERHQLCAEFGISERKLHALAMALDRGYAEQSVAPYHNCIHGADVLQAIHYFIRVHMSTSKGGGGGGGGELASTEVLACVLAAAIHDIDHPGKTNRWHVEGSSPLAMLYNDQSCNENHHLSVGLDILSQPEHDLTANMSREDKKGLRSMIIRLVLATDLANHFEFLSKMNTKLDAIDASVTSPRASSKPATAGPEMLLLMECAIKISDVSNGARSTPVYDKWSRCVFQEFYLQGDAERRQDGVAISPFMDRESPNEPQCQCSFLEYIVGPLFTLGKRLWPTLDAPAVQYEANAAALKQAKDNAAPCS